MPTNKLIKNHFQSQERLQNSSSMLDSSKIGFYQKNLKFTIAISKSYIFFQNDALPDLALSFNPKKFYF